MTIAEFIRANGLELVVLPADANPSMPTMPRNFRCEVSRYAEGSDKPIGFMSTPFSQGSTPFSQGSAHKKPPTLSDVLDCLASDASSVRNARDFEDWASEFGYDTDSRKAFATWEACQRQATELETLLGTDAFNTLLSDVERL